MKNNKTRNNKNYGINYDTKSILDTVINSENVYLQDRPNNNKGKNYSSASLDELLVMKNSQSNEEEKYILSHPACPIDQVKSLQNHINTLDTNLFTEMIHDKFYDPSVMKEAICVSNSLYYAAPGLVNVNERIRKWIQNLKQIDEGAEGYALQGSLVNDQGATAPVRGIVDPTGNSNMNKNLYKSNNNMFIIKAPSSESSNNLIHELFVGYQLNSLRPYTPNFAMAYGGFKCTSPIINSDKDVVSWCHKSSSPINYMLYENINPSESAKSYMDNANLDSFLNIYMQLLFSLRLAKKHLDYTHYDLHTGNVLIRYINNNNKNNNSKDFIIPYITENNKIEYLRTNVIATIIDNSFSHVEVDGKSYGFYNAIPYGVSPDKSFEIYDAHKFLKWSMYNMMESGNKTYLQLEPLLRYFNKNDDLDYVLEEEAQFSFPLPINKMTESLTLDDYISYIRNVYPQINKFISSKKTGNVRILGCNGTDVCVTNSEIKADVGLNKKLQVSTVFHFYDLVSRLEEENRYEAIDDVMSRFDASDAISSALDEYNDLSDKIMDEIKNLKTVDIGNTRLYDLLINVKLFNSVYEFTIDVMKILDMKTQLFLLYDSIMYTLEWFKIDDGKDEIDRLTNDINEDIMEYLELYDSKLDIFESNYEKIYKYYQSNKVTIDNSIFNGNSITTWYYNTLPTYYNILTDQ